MDVEAFVLAKAAINGALGTDELETEAKQIKPAINELYELIEGGGGGGSITMEQVLNAIYPVGAIAFGSHPTIGTWEKLEQDGALWLSTTETAGTTIDAGLPNITGSIINSNRSTDTNDFAIANSSTTTGAFEAVRAGAVNKRYPTSNTATAVWCDQVDFDASNSNAIYGKSTTVQPPAYVVDAWIRTA